jgi:hypothetical protein
MHPKQQQQQQQQQQCPASATGTLVDRLHQASDPGPYNHIAHTADHPNGRAIGGIIIIIIIIIIMVSTPHPSPLSPVVCCLA